MVSLTNPSSGEAELFRKIRVKTISTDADSVILTGMPLIMLKCDFFLGDISLPAIFFSIDI